MTLVLANRIKEGCTGSGTGNVVLTGAVSGFTSFVSRIPTGSKVPYVIQDGLQWEAGIGTLLSAFELSRDTVIDSSDTSTEVNNLDPGTPVKISLSDSPHTIGLAPMATLTLSLDENGDLADGSAFRSTVIVDTVTDMKALDGLVNGESVFCKGGSAVNDGKGGLFYFDSADATAADNVDTFRNDNYVTGLHKRVYIDIQSLVQDGLLDIDAAVADTTGGELRVFARKKATLATAYGGIQADYANSAFHLGARWLQASYKKFVSVFSLGTTADRVEITEPLVLPTRTDNTGFVARALSWLSGVSHLALAKGASSYWEIPRTKGGYIVGAYSTITALKAVDADDLFTNGDRAIVLGVSTVGDCAPFYVVWTSASSATADDAPVFRPTVGAASSGNGRWLRTTASKSRTFTSTDATPTIANGEFFVTAGTTAITDFDDAYEGQHFTVQRGASDIVITHNASVIDCGGSNVTLTATNPRATFFHQGGIHYLIGGAFGGVTPFGLSLLSTADAAAAVALLDCVDTVATIAALKAKTGGYVPTVIVQGKASLTDGGGGVFAWDATSASTNDDATCVTPNAGGTGRWKRVIGSEINVRWFGAKADAIKGTDGAITSGDATFTSASASFTSADVGKYIEVAGAGAAAATLVTTIASINSSTSVELTANAGTTVSGATHYYGTDDSAACQAAIDYAGPGGSGRRGKVYFPGGKYLLGTTLTVDSYGVWLEGDGPLGTTLYAYHTTTSVIRLKASYQGVRNMLVDATTKRNATSVTNGHGIWLETTDTAGLLARLCFFDKVDVERQPSTGVMCIGTVNGTILRQCNIQNNKEHGVCVDNGTRSGRSNLERSGLVTLEECYIFDNDGHGVLAGKDGESTNRTTRMIMRSCEVGRNAQAAGSRLAACQVYMFGDNNLIEACAFVGSNKAADTIIGRGIQIGGPGNIMLSNRFLEVTDAIRVASYAEFPTKGCVVDQIYVTGSLQAALDPAVVVDTACDGVSVMSEDLTFIDSLVATSWSQHSGRMMQASKVSAQSVTSSTTLVDCANMRLPLRKKEKMTFRCVIHYDAHASGDLKFGFTIPASATILWGPASGLIINTADTIAIQASVSSGTISVGGGGVGTVRTLVIEGQVTTAGTAGDLQLQFAQDTSNGSATRIQGSSYMEAVKR